MILLGSALLMCLGYIVYLRKQLAKLTSVNISQDAQVQKLSQLSKKEKEVLGLILENKSNKEIASDLFIELNTVKSHITKIYQKLEIKSRKELLNTFQRGV